jgi:hypothetical protein
MGVRLAFNRLVHSDWSKNPSKRWTAIAHLRDGLWCVDSLQTTHAQQQLLGALFSDDFKTLAGFDFAIGLPAAYLAKIEIGFLDLLLMLGQEPWHEFNSVADLPDEISLYRPFYPNRSRRGARRVDLVSRLDVESFGQLFRDCEKATRSRGPASPVFWTLGGKQVGKAALSGWQEIVTPARKLGASLWPFDGPLFSFASNCLTLAETYPGEVYQHIGMARTINKRSQEARRNAGATMLTWAARHDISLSPGIEKLIADGFGDLDSGEDPFDATAGLFGMIEVVEGRRAEAPDSTAFSKCGEGWILGQTDLPLGKPLVPHE